MSNRGSRILEGARAALAIARGELDPSSYRVHVPADINVAALRRRLKMSQSQFAAHFGFTPARIRDWEQGRSKPDGAVRAYLMVILKEPEAVARALNPAPTRRRTRSREPAASPG
jgi:putative transcriptional regulator